MPATIRLPMLHAPSGGKTGLPRRAATISHVPPLRNPVMSTPEVRSCAPDPAIVTVHETGPPAGLAPSSAATSGAEGVKLTVSSR